MRASAHRRAWRYGGELWGEGEVRDIDTPGRYPGVFALHGFGATPNELELVTDLAQELGLATRAPLLPGHGTHAKELATTRYRNWFDSAATELRRFASSGPVIMLGQSMGSVLAMDLTVQFPHHVAGLVVLANATRMKSPYPDLAMALAERLRLPDIKMPKFGGPDIALAEERATHRTYSSQPLFAAQSLRRAGLQLLTKLHQVRCPTFIAHGLHDQVCPVSNAWAVADALGTSDVQVLLLARSRHIITKDADRARLREHLRHFLLGFAGPFNDR
jgi:carboxylesterase